jgi:hypothetical protein
MWILLPFGFFSIVEKPGDRGSGMLTVRARAKADLAALRQRMPELRATIAHEGTDYPFRARAPRQAIAAMFARFVDDELDYHNFKDEVADQDPERAHVYHDVWSALTRIERPLDRAVRRRP